MEEFLKQLNLEKEEKGYYDTHHIISKLRVANRNIPYNNVPKPKWKMISILESWEHVVVVQNKAQKQYTTCTYKGKQRGDKDIQIDMEIDGDEQGSQSKNPKREGVEAEKALTGNDASDGIP